MSQTHALGRAKADDLKGRVQHILSLEQSRKRVATMLKENRAALTDAYAEAASVGFHAAILKARVRELLMDGDQLRMVFEAEAQEPVLRAVYRDALGISPATATPSATGAGASSVAEMRRRGWVQSASGVWGPPEDAAEAA
jgi:uncharacterized protein (UPF0335 family)